MDQLDRQILDALQNDFPLSQKPYEAVSGRLKISCRQLLGRLEVLKSDGVIRRVGASLDSRKLGFCGTLAAISVPPDTVEQASEIISSFAEVTHSYLRKDDFNIWFTIIAPNNERVENILKQIRSALCVESLQILNLPAKRFFKLNACFCV